MEAIESIKKLELFRKELEVIINKYSMENGSNTPDFILADYLFSCLIAYNKAVVKRDKLRGVPEKEE